MIRATAASCLPSASHSRLRPSRSRCVALALVLEPSSPFATTPLSSQANCPQAKSASAKRVQEAKVCMPLRSTTASCRCLPTIITGFIIYLPHLVHHLLTLAPPPPRPHHFPGLHDGADQSPTACALPPPFFKLCFVRASAASFVAALRLVQACSFSHLFQKCFCVVSDNLSGGHIRRERGRSHWRQVVDVEVTAYYMAGNASLRLRR